MDNITLRIKQGKREVRREGREYYDDSDGTQGINDVLAKVTSLGLIQIHVPLVSVRMFRQ